MPSYKNYKRDNVKNANVKDLTKKPQMTNNEISSVVSKESFKEQFKKWITFFKLNYDMFATWYLGLDLYLYQKIVLHMMGISNLAVIIASRGIDLKSHLIVILD